MSEPPELIALVSLSHRLIKLAYAALDVYMVTGGSNRGQRGSGALVKVGKLLREATPMAPCSSGS